MILFLLLQPATFEEFTAHIATRNIASINAITPGTTCNQVA